MQRRMGGRVYLARGGSVSGALLYGTQIVLDDFSSTTEYAFTVQNPTTNGLGVRIRASGGANIATFNDAAVTLASADGTKTLVVANAGITASAITTTGGTYTTPTLATPTITGVATFPAGSFGAPSAAFVDSTLGWYRVGANSIGLGSGTSTRTIKLGKGSPSLAMVEVVQDTANGSTINGATNASPIVISTTSAHGFATGEYVAVIGVGGNTAANGIWIITVLSSTTFSLTGSTGNGSYTSGGTCHISPRYGFYSAQGTHATPLSSANGVLPYTPSIQGDVVASLGSTGLTVAAVKGAAYAISGDSGFILGGDFQAETGGSFNGGGGGLAKGAIGVRGVASSEEVATYQQVLTAGQFNARGYVANDTIHGVEINLATRDDTNTDPAHRVGVIIATERNARSRRGTTLDTCIALIRKKLDPDSFTNCQPFKYGIFFGDDESSVTDENFPFDSTSSFFKSAASTGTMGGFINLSNVVIAEDGPVMIFDSGGADPLIHVKSVDDAGTGTLSGWIGIGTTPARPLHIKTAENSVMAFSGTVANWTTTSVGAAGGASAMPTPLGYLRVNLNGTNVLFAYFTNA